MNATVILAVVIGLFAGAVFLGLAIFFWYLLKTVRDLKLTVERFTGVMDPLVKTGALQGLANAATQSLGIARQMLQAMKAINATVAIFNKAFFNKEAVAKITEGVTGDGGYAEAGESAVFGYNEEEAATREKQGILRKNGIETDHTRIQEPTVQQMKGSSV